MKLASLLALRGAHRLVALALRLGAPPVLAGLARGASRTACWFARL